MPKKRARKGAFWHV